MFGHKQLFSVSDSWLDFVEIQNVVTISTGVNKCLAECTKISSHSILGCFRLWEYTGGPLKTKNRWCVCKRLGASADWDSLGVSNSFLYIFIQETGQRDCSWVFKYSPCPLFNRALMNTMHRILCFKFLFNLCRLFFSSVMVSGKHLNWLLFLLQS